MASQSNRTVDIVVAGSCGLTCAVCDCRTQATLPEEALRELRGGGVRLTLRGAPAAGGPSAEYVKEARRRGFGEIALRINAQNVSSTADAAHFSQMGVDVAVVPIFSEKTPVHDHIAERPGALVKALVGMRALAGAGLSIEIEVPILPARLQDLTKVVELAHRAVPTLRAVRFHLPREPVPATISPPSWDEAGERLADVLRRCEALGIKAPIRRADGVPFCAMPGAEDLHQAYRFHPTRKLPAVGGSSFLAPCTGCAARDQCPGVARAYAAANADRGLTPFATRPDSLYHQGTTALRVWTDAQREAASQRHILVLRPTVNCNQDCTFCSANETTGNVWNDWDAMLRQITRAGRSGVRWLSFSGGEPALSRDLALFIQTARRSNIDNVELVTNGVLLDTPRRIDPLVGAGLTHGFVSLHAHNEALSQHLTQKVGDFDKTVAAVDLMLERGLEVTLNHVITERNFRYLHDFVAFAHRRWKGEAVISFAFVTPQYKALENIDLVPRLSEVAPYLRRALHLAVQRRQRFVVGSRQGIPPCFLGEFQAWSDIRQLAHEAQSEDAPQKTRGPQCDECRFSTICQGLWRPYVARYGLDEPQPVAGAPVGPSTEQLRPRSFDDLPEQMRRRDSERGGVERAQAEVERLEANTSTEKLSLPVFKAALSRPLRLAMFGTGRQARRLAEAIHRVAGLTLDAVASPHAPASSGPTFGHCPSYQDAAEALDGVRPDGVIVAAATGVHVELARLAIEAGLPVLIEKPLAATEASAKELIEFAQGRDAIVVMAHNVLHEAGLETVFQMPRPKAVRLTHHVPPGGPEHPTSWQRESLYQSLYHALVLAHRAAGGGPAEVLETSFVGSSAPERLRAHVRFGEVDAEIAFDFDSASDHKVLQVSDATGDELTWKRSGPDIELTRSSSGTLPVERRGNDVEAMLAAFARTIAGKEATTATPQQALEVMETAWAILDALEATGAAFERPGAPRHVKSRAFRAVT